MKNDTTTLAPINTLPPEILARVFALSGPHCARVGKGKVEFHDLAAVCSYWRLIALDTAAVWSHIDIGPNTPEGLTQLLLERTKNIPIDVHAFEPGPPPDYNSTTEQEVARTVDTLIPHIHRVRALYIHSYSFYPGFTAAMTNLWLDNGGASLPESLVIIIPHMSPTAHAPGIESNLSESENAKGVMRLLGTLHLENINFGWNSGAYCDLVDLRLSFRPGYVSIRISEFAEILSASPLLAILKLEYLEVRQTEGRSQPTPRLMKYLSVLNLVNMGPSSLKLLLPLISLRGSLTDASVGISLPSQMHHELEAFLLHSRVTTLYYLNRGVLPSFQPPLLLSPHLRTLILTMVSLPNVPVGETIPSHSQQPPPSHPPHVILTYCNITFEGLKNLIESHGVRELDLERCMVPRESHHDLHDIRNLLLDLSPELQCRVSDTDSTQGLPCCTTFDYFNRSCMD